MQWQEPSDKQGQVEVKLQGLVLPEGLRLDGQGQHAHPQPVAGGRGEK